MLCEIFKPEQRLALAGKGHRHPAKWVIEVPDRDTHTCFNLDAGSHSLDHDELVLMSDNCAWMTTYIVIRLLLLQQIGLIRR